MSIVILRTTTKISSITKTIFTYLLRIKVLGNNGLQIKQNKTLPILVIFITFENLKETNFELSEENLLLHWRLIGYIPHSFTLTLSANNDRNCISLLLWNLRANAGVTRSVGSIPGSGKSPRREQATHSSILAWRIPWTEETGRLHEVSKSRIRLKWLSRHAWRSLKSF